MRYISCIVLEPYEICPCFTIKVQGQTRSTRMTRAALVAEIGHVRFVRIDMSSLLLLGRALTILTSTPRADQSLYSVRLASDIAFLAVLFVTLLKGRIWVQVSSKSPPPPRCIIGELSTEQ